MSPTELWSLGFVALACGASLIALVASALLDRSGRIRLRHWAEESGGRILQLHEDARGFDAFRLLLAVVSRVALAAAGLLAARAYGLGVAAVLVLTTAFLGEVWARSARRSAETSLRRWTRLYRWSAWALLPLMPLAVRAVAGETRSTTAAEPEDEASSDEIEAFLNVGSEEGILEPGEEDLVARVIDFGDEIVRHAMTPRTEMVAAPVDSDLDTLASLFLESRHSRIPLYQESVEEIVGVLHLRDLLAGLRANGEAAASELMTPPLLIPETKALSVLLEEFQSQRQQLALVVNEFGATVGLITVEDVLEEIVGEIVDEYETAQPLYIAVADGRWRLDGGADLDVLETLFGTAVELDSFETVGGLVFGLIGDVPKVGDEVEHEGIHFRVEEVDARRVRRVLVRHAGGDRRAE